MQTPEVFIGVDVAKAQVVAAAHEGAIALRSVSNDAPSLRRWLAQLPQGAVLGVESTGAYHQLLVQLAHQRGLRAYVLNARDVYFYARGLGVRGKTDRVDARLIARYLAEHHARLHPWRPSSTAQRQIEDLLRRRAQAVKHQAALRLSFSTTEGLEPAWRALQDQFAALLKALDARIAQLLESDAQLAEDARRLRSIVGVGPQGSAMLAVPFNRLAFRNADAVVAYSGLDPRPHDSGSRHGRRHLSKRGPAALRRQVFLIGLAASHSKALKPLYQALRAKGLASTEALLVLGRKLLRVAFALWRHQEDFDESRFQRQAACGKT